jgi:ABC-type branched-subunit amino acid transport system ATPase component
MIATATEPVIAASGLFAGYGKTVVVRDLDLEVHPGEVTALLGPNGAGKTTTLLTLSGALAPLGGQISFRGQVNAKSLHRRAREGLALVTEQRAVFARLSVEENLRIGKCDREFALGLFPELEEHLKRRVGLLSGGQQQMLALARALSRHPALLLADELSLGLAPLIVGRLLRAVRDAADAGVGVLVVEQHVTKALDIADRVYVMNRGQVVMQGMADDIKDRIGDVQLSYLAGE